MAKLRQYIFSLLTFGLLSAVKASYENYFQNATRFFYAICETLVLYQK